MIGEGGGTSGTKTPRPTSSSATQPPPKKSASTNDVDLDYIEMVDEDVEEFDYTEFEDGKCEEGDGDHNEETHDYSSKSTTQFAIGDLIKHQDILLEALKNSPSKLNEMRTAVAELINYVNDMEVKINAGKYSTSDGKRLEEEYNQKKKDISELMKKILPPGMKHLVNTANQFSVDTLIVFFLHYAPPGLSPDATDEFDYCTFTQCCIHTMKSKLINFLHNEDKHGVGKMDEWKYGGKTHLNVSHHMAVVDLVPLLLEKKKKMKEMEAQYNKYTNELSLDNYYELMAISYSFARMHLLLAKVCHPGEKIQLHMASSATAKHLLGLSSGVSKYLQKYVYKTFNITIGPHPQVYLMGVCKSERLFPKGVQEVINQHLVEVYSHIITFKEDFKSQLMSIFGGVYADGVNVGIYSHLAKVLETYNLLDLDTNKKYAVIDAKPSATVEDAKPSTIGEKEAIHYAQILTNEGVNAADIELFKDEFTPDLTIGLLMSRMRKFRDGARLHGMAALMPTEWTPDSSEVPIPDHLNTMINALMDSLDKTRDAILKSLHRIKNAQDANGDHRKLTSKLARIYNDNGGDEVGRKAVTNGDGKQLFIQYSQLYNNDLIAAMEMVVKFAEKCDATFWRNYAKLVKYKDDNEFAMVDILDDEGENKSVLFVYTTDELYAWFCEQVNYEGSTGLRRTVVNCGYHVKAWERIGSTEYNVLLNLEASFSNEDNRKANENEKKRRRNASSGGGFGTNQHDMFRALG